MTYISKYYKKTLLLLSVNFWEDYTLSNLYSSVRGAPVYPPLMMFKILILQAWYNLSDEALEKQIARDLMFRRFIDLSLSEFTTPKPLTTF